MPPKYISDSSPWMNQRQVRWGKKQQFEKKGYIEKQMKKNISLSDWEQPNKNAKVKIE